MNNNDQSAPATLDGLSPCSVYLPAGTWSTVLEFLVEKFPRVQSETWISRMHRGLVVDHRGATVTPSTKYEIGDRISYFREFQDEQPVPFIERIIYRDDHLLVADKPPFLPVTPSGRFVHETLLVRLKAATGINDLVPIHRIDRETAGVVLFSVNAKTRGDFASLFERREVAKVYEAIAPATSGLEFPHLRRSRIVAGNPFFRMKEVEGEPNAETLIDILSNLGDKSLYRAKPITGKKHQIRVHFTALGIPIVNDKLYPNLIRDTGDGFLRPLQLLARSISFRNPLTNQLHHFESDQKLELIEQN